MDKKDKEQAREWVEEIKATGGDSNNEVKLGAWLEQLLDETELPDEPPEKIFSGDASREMWRTINSLEATGTIDDVHDAIYHVCCQIQKLESKFDKAMIKAGKKDE